MENNIDIDTDNIPEFFHCTNIYIIYILYLKSTLIHIPNIWYIFLVS